MTKIIDSTNPVKRRRWSPNIDEESPACIVIDIFGGLTPFCRATTLAPSTVHGWLTKGLIPQESWPWILQCAAENSVVLDYRDFIDRRIIEV